MSYESNVALMVNKSDYETLKNKFQKLDKYCKAWLKNAEKRGHLSFGNKKENNEYTYLYWDDEKWDEHLPEVKTVMDLTRTLEKEDRTYDYIRIGDNENDIEHRYKNDQCFEVKRTIKKF